MEKPCAKCPWMNPAGDPDLNEEVREAARRGSAFCCHVRMGTCWGAVRHGAKPMEDR